MYIHHQQRKQQHPQQQQPQQQEEEAPWGGKSGSVSDDVRGKGQLPFYPASSPRQQHQVLLVPPTSFPPIFHICLVCAHCAWFHLYSWMTDMCCTEYAEAGAPRKRVSFTDSALEVIHTPVPLPLMFPRACILVSDARIYD